jgi:uncharacterized membrane protein (DUF485 family)
VSEASKKAANTPSSGPDFEKIAGSPEFQALMSRKKRFMITATIFFVLYYFALPVFTGYFEFLNVKIFGSMNGAYLFALSQFFMAWILALLYVRHANKNDRMIEEILKKQGRKDS